jgi:hypothetical protein
MARQDDLVQFRKLIDRGFSAGELGVVDEVIDPACVEHQRGLKPAPRGSRRPSAHSGHGSPTSDSRSPMLSLTAT